MNMPGFSGESAIAVLPQAQNTGRGLTHEVISPQQLARQNEGNCVGRYMACTVRCYLRNSPYLQGCLDSCSAALNLCQTTGVRATVGGGVAA
jgi:hypothetical protein